MSAAPVGAVVRFSYDEDARNPEPLKVGDFIRTAKTGRFYLVMAVRAQERGKHVGRKHLVALVRASARPGARVFPLYWYPRKRRSRLR